MIRELVLRIVVKLSKKLAGPDCGEGVVRNAPGENVRERVAELAFGPLVDGNVFSSSRCNIVESKDRSFAVNGNSCVPRIILL